MIEFSRIRSELNKYKNNLRPLKTIRSVLFDEDFFEFIQMFYMESKIDIFHLVAEPFLGPMRE